MTLRVTLSSLTNRVFLAGTLLATLSLGIAFYFVNQQATAEAESTLRRSLTEAGTLVDQHQATRSDYFRRLARVVADLPKLKAAVETADPPTVQPLADEYRGEINADALVLTGRRGEVLAAAGEDAAQLVGAAPLPDAGEISTFRPHRTGVAQVVSVPIYLAGEIPDILGRLTVGVLLDDGRATELRGLTGSEIAFGTGSRVLASSLAGAESALEAIAGAPGIQSVNIGDEEYLALTRSLGPPGGAVAFVLTSRTERLRFLSAIRTRLLAVLAVMVLLATVTSYVVARTMTRPLTSLTDYVTQVQKEAAQKDRLSALGRLSTVIAHEIRNPLMIIKASLVSLRQDSVSTADLQDAVNDIEEEANRLNRIVTEVLDFAKPIRFDFAEADVNDVCRESGYAAWAGQPDDDLAFDLDPALPAVVTDAERLRGALINLISNARQAVAAARARATRQPVGQEHVGRTLSGSPGEPDKARPTPVSLAEPPAVTVVTRHVGDRVVIAIRDRGIGIAPEDMAHIFDPYFTTRRAGTGLGLPIAKNIIEGLGGTINISSTPAAGTEIRIEFPIGQRLPERLNGVPLPEARA